MIGLFLRQWRRILLAAAFLAASLVLAALTGRAPGDVETDPLGIFVLAAFLTSLVVVTPLAALLSALAPRLLALFEPAGMALFTGVAVMPAWTRLGLPEWADCLLIGGLIYLAGVVLDGRWQARFAGPGRARTASVTIARPGDAVWRALRPDPSRPEAHYWPGTAIEGEDPWRFVMVRPRRGRLPDERVSVAVEEAVPGRHFTMTLEPEGAGPRLRLETGLAETEKGTRVTVTEQVLSATPGARFFWWLSADLKDHLASMKNRIEGRRDPTLHGRQMIRAEAGPPRPSGLAPAE